MEATSTNYTSGYLYKLPVEVQNEIFAYSSISGIAHIAQTCKLFNKVITEKVTHELNQIKKLIEFSVELIRPDDLKQIDEIIIDIENSENSEVIAIDEVRKQIKLMVLNNEKIIASSLPARKKGVNEGIEFLQEIFNLDSQTTELIKEFVFAPKMKSTHLVLGDFRISPEVLGIINSIHSLDQSVDNRQKQDLVAKEIKKLATNDKFILAVKEMEIHNLLPFHKIEITEEIQNRIDQNKRNEIVNKIPKTIRRNQKCNYHLKRIIDSDIKIKAVLFGCWVIGVGFIIIERKDIAAPFVSVATVVILAIAIIKIITCARHCQGYTRINQGARL